ncbi:hypothetical protein PoB_007241900 [Plakobranchus ocellatus]|uniref:Uncharacterized protein n=1 Tax=Plakobranchus ocellatus TaxID=259542 RepID=A0AAV4DPH6_9GAST|nr:hypothetical protein PoB_007241900 [Plakobranchus ocellatus]
MLYLCSKVKSWWIAFVHIARPKQRDLVEPVFFFLVDSNSKPRQKLPCEFASRCANVVPDAFGVVGGTVDSKSALRSAGTPL